MSGRETLRARRPSVALSFRQGGLEANFTVAFSLYPPADGAPPRCAEIFLNCEPTGGALEANIRDAAILASFALQHGVPLAALIAGLTHEPDGSCSSLVGQALHLVAREIDRWGTGDAAPAGDGPAGDPPAGGTGGAAAATGTVPEADEGGRAATGSDVREAAPC